IAVVLGAIGPSCIDRPVVPIEPGGHGVHPEILRVTRVDKVDLLFVVDNSSSMADKQSELGKRIPDLIAAITTPPSTSSRKSSVIDVHVAVITSSLGSHGTAACASAPGSHFDDQAHLLPRADDATTSGWKVDAVGAAPTPAACPKSVASSALRWVFDPKTAKNGELSGTDGATTLQTAASCLVESAQDTGCGYEETLESMVHFLVDPAPYASAKVACSIGSGGGESCGDNQIQVTGRDDVLLEQRRQFLRADSLVAIVILSDENDASLMPVGKNWRPWAYSTKMAKAWGGCASVPDDFDPSTPADYAKLAKDWSCKSCEDDSSDPACTSAFGGAPSGPFMKDVDHINLRPFDQVQRFGKSYLWPVQRYVDALTKPQFVGSDGKIGPNALFAGGRTPERVVVAGIVGVPKGLVSDADGNPKKLEAADWEKIISPDLAKRDPHMIESIGPRPGVPHFDATSPGADTVNGGDRDMSVSEYLQYACIAPRATPSAIPRECDYPNADKIDPTCGPGGVVKSFRAYPGLRHLRMLHDLGTSGFVASICDTSYASAIRGVIDKVQNALAGQCLTTVLDVDDTGDVQCLVLESFEAAQVEGKARCEDVGKGYCTPGTKPCRLDDSNYPPLDLETAAAQLNLPISSVDADGVTTKTHAQAYTAEGNVYVDGDDGKKHLVCEMMQLAGGRVPKADADACQTDQKFSIAPGAGGGYCYSRDPAVVGEACKKAGSVGTMRFLGDVDPKGGSEVFTLCIK
ncbi:MAG: hypothetical protein ABI175_06035, partial [Polyangiales bacterium]